MDTRPRLTQEDMQRIYDAKHIRILDIRAGIHFIPRRLSTREKMMYPEYVAEQQRLKEANKK